MKKTEFDVLKQKYDMLSQLDEIFEHKEQSEPTIQFAFPPKPSDLIPRSSETCPRLHQREACTITLSKGNASMMFKMLKMLRDEVSKELEGTVIISPDSIPEEDVTAETA